MSFITPSFKNDQNNFMKAQQEIIQIHPPTTTNYKMFLTRMRYSMTTEHVDVMATQTQQKEEMKRKLEDTCTKTQIKSSKFKDNRCHRVN